MARHCLRCPHLTCLSKAISNKPPRRNLSVIFQHQAARHWSCIGRFHVKSTKVGIAGFTHEQAFPVKQILCQNPKQSQRQRALSSTACLHASDTPDKPPLQDVEDEDEEALWEARYNAFFQDDYILPGSGHRVFVLQPEVKRGSSRAKLTTAELQLAEACALVESLPGWSVVDKAIFTLKYRDKKHLYGRGNFEEITQRVVCSKKITAVFVSLNMLSALQLSTLQDSWSVPVYDRYTMVLQIFKMRAHTREAQLQVALAEIPYYRSRLRGMHAGTLDKQVGGLANLGGSGESYLQMRQRILHEKEMKIRKALAAVKSNRELLRKERKKREFPIIAVVGYTNAGKTSLIKALTGSVQMKPRDQLFATLDVTAHAGFLQGRMKVIYMDTVGFISDIPTTLIDSFAATLEDLLSATVILHVRDISHPDTEAQKANVLATLASLDMPSALYEGMIEVCNKMDLLPAVSKENEASDEEKTCMFTSAKTGEGLTQLTTMLEEAVINSTDRVVKHLKIPTGGEHLSWLYKEACVRKTTPHDPDGASLLVDAVMTQSVYGRFLARFGKKKKTAH